MSYSRRQHSNYRSKNHNRYDQIQFDDYEYYDSNHSSQRSQQQQKKNRYNCYHSDINRQNQYSNCQYYNYNYNTYPFNEYESFDEYPQYNTNTQNTKALTYEYEPQLQTKSIPINSKSREKTRNIRDMNNWCKYVNITHSIREAYKDNQNNKINILDLGCGKGSDLYKCRGNKKYISKYLGIDLCSESIATARQKYSKILETNIIHRNASAEQRKKFGLNNAYGQTANEFFNEPIFDAQFICDDMNIPTLLSQNLMHSKKPFQLINIQFALHYSFQSKLSLLSLFETFNKYTEKGTYFICSFVRDDIILKRLSKAMDRHNSSDSVCFENEYQSISMQRSDFEWVQSTYAKHALLESDSYLDTVYGMKRDRNGFEFDASDGLIGIPYQYYQMDSIEGDNGNGLTEHLIPFAVLCRLLWKYCGMRLVYKKNCTDIYIESSRAFPYKYGYSKGRELDSVEWTKDEKDVIDTYCYALFKRV